MEEENNNNNHHHLSLDYSMSDLDFSFTSTASTSTFASSSTCSARSSLSLSLPSFSASTTLISPLPHSKSHNSPHWSAVRAAANLSKDGNLHLRHLHLLRHLGSGHLARVFHCRLKGSESFDFALKVVDLDAAAESKLSHVVTESRVLSALDHPFLPTLYARMDASHYACFLIDYCSGGDLHSLLLRHPGHRLPLHAIRFLAAEVLLALEYLHALGFVYRDLKPENILIREDGHVMLSDFDLCFEASVQPAVVVSNEKRRAAAAVEFVAEPEGAWSKACVGTHEYLAPEMVKGSGHGSAVDWWAFGIFMYELLYGRTPFKGSTKEETLRNIVRKGGGGGGGLRFPDVGEVGKEERAARDLIARLLVRDDKERMGSKRGAAEIKKHHFFKGLNWALVRTQRSPLVVASGGTAVVVREVKGKGTWWSRMNKCVLRAFVGSSNSNSKKVKKMKENNMS